MLLRPQFLYDFFLKIITIINYEFFKEIFNIPSRGFALQDIEEFLSQNHRFLIIAFMRKTKRNKSKVMTV